MNRIGILIPTLKKGGAEKQASLLARALNSGNNEVTLIVVNPECGIEKELIALSGLAASQIVYLKGIKQWNLYKILRNRHIDTLFCYLTWPDFYGVIIGRMAGVKYIYQGLRNAHLPKSKLMLERIGNILSTGVVTNNYSGAEIFKNKGIKHQIVIPNCYINIQGVSTRPERDTVTVITVGRFVSQKDYPTAIKAMTVAMRKNPHLRFKIIGHGELESSVRAMVAESGVADRIEILINPPGIINHLLDADIYLSTSLFEGTSNSIMEAMDASLPIVATNVGDNSYLVYDGENGFITDTGEVDKIADCILNLAASRDLRDRMGLHSNNILKRDFSFEKFRKTYLNLIT